MNKPASILSVGGVRRLIFLKPVAILLAVLILPPELPFLGKFSLTPKANAQITVCGNQASIFQVCSQPSNAFEVEAVSDYEKQYNLKPGDGNLIYTYGRTDLRMSFRAFMFDKLLGAILNSPANRTAAEQGMINYFQGLVQQHEIAQYTAATADRDLFQQHLCQWVPDSDIEKAYDVSVSTSPYCGFTVTPITALFNGPPDLPTIDYFVTKGYKVAYEQPLEAVVASNAASQSVISGGLVAQLELTQTQIAEIAALGSVSVQGPGVMIASRAITPLTRAIFPTSAGRLNLQLKRAAGIGGKVNLEEIGATAARAIRILGAASAVLEVATTVISVVFAVLDAEAQQNEIDTLNADLSNAKNNPPDLKAFAKDDTGFQKLTSVFLELTLPEFESPAALPLPGPNDPHFITNSASVTNQTGPITFQDQSGKTWTAQPYSQNWIVMTGFDQNKNPITRFSNYLTYLGPDTSNNTTAYKAWINNGSFMVAKLSPGTNNQICEAGANGLYQGSTTNCASFTPDHLTINDVNGNPMNITMSQGVVLDSPNPPNVAFAAGVGGTFTIKAHGIPAPGMAVLEVMPIGCGTKGFDNQTVPGVATIQLVCTTVAQPTSFTFHLVVSNTASTITVPIKLDIDSAVHITSPTSFTVTYGVPVNFVVTATGSPVQINIPANPWPEGITITDNGNGAASITGTPLPSNKVDGQCFINPCNVTASNGLFSDASPLQVTVLAPSARVTSPNQVTFRAGEYNEFVITLDGGVTPAGFNVYHVIDFCRSSDPPWLIETQRPNGDLLLSGTPPFILTNQTYHLGFAVPLVGVQNFGVNCQNAPNFTLNVGSFPIFPPSPFLIALPGSPVPSTNFQMGSSFNSLSFTGPLPAGLSFNPVSDAFSFSGTVPVNTAPGDYRLSINSTIISNNNTGTEMFDFIVGQPPVDNGFKTFNLVVNQPANLLINPSGFPKNAVGPLPAMTANFNIFLPAGVQQQPGPMDGSIQVTGTPTQLGQFFGFFTASNGVPPDWLEAIAIRVINPGDINADGHVDCSDLSMVKAALNTKLGLPGYNNLADVNGDGIVNAQDLALVAKYMPTGTRCQ